jgi:broad specificity phosphatase PhoE
MAADALTLEAMLAPAAQFRSSDLQRRYRAVLDSARRAPVQVTDRDGHRLAVGDWDEMVLATLFMRILDQIGQFHAVWARHRDEPPSEWATMTPFPFLAAFDGDDVEQFADELIPYLEEAVRRRDLEGWLGNLRAWQSSAETYDDERMLARMRVKLDPAKLVAISPPGE